MHLNVFIGCYLNTVYPNTSLWNPIVETVIPLVLEEIQRCLGVDLKKFISMSLDLVRSIQSEVYGICSARADSNKMAGGLKYLEDIVMFVFHDAVGARRRGICCFD